MRWRPQSQRSNSTRKPQQRQVHANIAQGNLKMRKRKRNSAWAPAALTPNTHDQKTQVQKKTTNVTPASCVLRLSRPCNISYSWPASCYQGTGCLEMSLGLWGLGLKDKDREEMRKPQTRNRNTLSVKPLTSIPLRQQYQISKG